MTREENRSAMNAQFEYLPDWLREPFAPVRDAVTILMDELRDREAAALVAAIPVPADFTEEQAATFVAVREQMAAGIEALIPPNPLDSDEARAVLDQSELNREASR